MKEMGNGTRLFADYREKTRKLYAYHNKTIMPESLFNEFKAINTIEREMLGDISAYA